MKQVNSRTRPPISHPVLLLSGPTRILSFLWNWKTGSWTLGNWSVQVHGGYFLLISTINNKISSQCYFAYAYWMHRICFQHHAISPSQHLVKFHAYIQIHSHTSSSEHLPHHPFSRTGDHFTKLTQCHVHPSSPAVSIRVPKAPLNLFPSLLHLVKVFTGCLWVSVIVILRV